MKEREENQTTYTTNFFSFCFFFQVSSECRAAAFQAQARTRSEFWSHQKRGADKRRRRGNGKGREERSSCAKQMNSHILHSLWSLLEPKSYSFSWYLIWGQYPISILHSDFLNLFRQNRNVSVLIEQYNDIYPTSFHKSSCTFRSR